MAKAGKKAAQGKKKRRPVRRAASHAAKKSAGRQPSKLRKTFRSGTGRPKGSPDARRKPRAPMRKPQSKKPAKAALKRRAARKPARSVKGIPGRKSKKPAGKPAQSSPQRQIILVEEKKPLMASASAPLPSILPPAAPPVPATPTRAAPAPRGPVSQPPPITPAQKPQAPPHIDASGPSDGPLAIPLAPALDLLPEWEDRLRLKRAIFEDGLTFFSLGRHCPEFHEASSMLAPSGKKSADSIPGYFIVCMKDRAGKMVGAMDGHMLDGGVMAIGRSAARGEKRRELHILLYSAALSGHQPSFIIFSAARAAITVDSAALFILLGRGFGFSAIPVQLADRILLIRRVRQELDPISSGQEISFALKAALGLLEGKADSAISEISEKGIMPLVPLPTSPDSREHLHELRDLVSMLGLPTEGLDSVIELLRIDYVLGRKDITPELIS